MDYIRLDALTIDCQRPGNDYVEFKVNIDGKRSTHNNSDFFEIPLKKYSYIIDIEMVSKASMFFNARATFKYEGIGNLYLYEKIEGHVKDVSSINLEYGRTFTLSFYLSRIQDVTHEAIDIWKKGRDGKKNLTTKWWQFPEREVNVLKHPSISDGQFSFERKKIHPSAQHYVFELKDVDSPQRISVTWPASLQPKLGTTSVPIWMYFKPNIKQGVKRGRFPVGTYPNHYDFYEQIFAAKLLYRHHDPLYYANDHGLIYQLEAAGKEAVVIIPCNSWEVNPEIGVFMKGNNVQKIFREIIAFRYREAGIFQCFPDIGHFVLSFFSASNRLGIDFLSNNMRNSFVSSYLKEVYSFDPPGDTESKIITLLSQWVGNDADRVGRFYVQDRGGNGGFQAFLPKASFPGQSLYCVKNSSNNRSVFRAHWNAWKSFWTNEERINEEGYEYKIPHQLICSILHVHALRVSSLPRKSQ